MKLHAFNLLLAMTQSHDHTIARLGRNLQTIRQAFTFDHQRMITTGFEGGLEIAEDRLTIVKNFRRLAVHNCGCTHDTSAKNLANGLMAQANTQHRNTSGEIRYEGEGYSRLGRATRSRRDQNATRKIRLNVTECCFVVSPHEDVL